MSTLLGDCRAFGVFCRSGTCQCSLFDTQRGKIGIFLYGTHPESVAEHANVPYVAMGAQGRSRWTGMSTLLGGFWPAP
jgi:hypothetical protein